MMLLSLEGHVYGMSTFGGERGLNAEYADTEGEVEGR